MDKITIINDNEGIRFIPVMQAVMSQKDYNDLLKEELNNPMNWLEQAGVLISFTFRLIIKLFVFGVILALILAVIFKTEWFHLLYLCIIFVGLCEFTQVSWRFWKREDVVKNVFKDKVFQKLNERAIKHALVPKGN